MYRLIFDESEKRGESIFSFEIIDGEFSGIFIEISNIEISDDLDENGLHKLEYDYTITYVPENLKDVDVSESFINLIGNVLNDVLKKAIEWQKVEDERIHEQDGQRTINLEGDFDK